MSLYTDILLIVPLEEEFGYVKEIFPDFEEDSASRGICPELPILHRMTHRSGLEICAVVLKMMCNEHSALIAERCIRRLRPRLVIGLGISGSLDENYVLLGDVVVSSSVCNYLGEAKAIDVTTRDKGEILDFKNSMSRHTYPVRDALLSQFDATKRFERWRADCEAARTALGLTIDTGDPAAAGGAVQAQSIFVAHEQPRLHVESIASGPVVGASQLFKDFLESVDRKFAVMEMEGAGIALACKRQPGDGMDFLLIRGVSDFADRHKSELEKRSKDRWRQLATGNAARLFDHLLNDAEFRRTLRSNSTATQPLNIALFLSDHVHYVDSIAAGFRDELSKIYDGTRFWPHVVQDAGSPRESDNASNIKRLEKLIEDSQCEFVVTIGTSATRAAAELLRNEARKLVFLGVSQAGDTGFADRPATAGVSYGVDVATTVELLKAAYPTLQPVFLHSPSAEYSQDNLLLEALRRRYSREEVDDCELTEVKEFYDENKRRIYFGRFFLCKNMRDFCRKNQDKAFVGVSVENTMKGAVMSVGYDTLEIGRLGAREILASNHLLNKSLRDIKVLHPAKVFISYNSGVAARLGVQISDEFRLRVTHQFD
jgi:nucleoside phosphorylase/ABC-type uncharacterized transport system substrate-binding protein